MREEQVLEGVLPPTLHQRSQFVPKQTQQQNKTLSKKIANWIVVTLIY
jgi:hypothetical protein